MILPEALDKVGSPICVEQYNFVPAEVFKHITIEDYIVFVMYSLEYRSLIVEQLSEQRERAYLASLTPEQRAALESESGNDGSSGNGNSSTPYGVLVNTCVIRDLSKFIVKCLYSMYYTLLYASFFLFLSYLWVGAA